MAHTQLLSESKHSGKPSLSEWEWVWEAVHWRCLLWDVVTQGHLGPPSAPCPRPFTWSL